jgi:multidrug efflux pump subunit AcrA (membrane-fusion protein)
VSRNVFSRSEEKQLKSESALDVDNVPRMWGKQNPPCRTLVGWPGALIVIGLSIAIAARAISLFSQPPAKPAVGAKLGQPQITSLSVTVAPVETTPIARVLKLTGMVAARDHLIPVLAQVPGLQIKQVLVKEGNVLQAGQVMAVLDQSVLKTQIDQAQAQLQSTQAVVVQKQAALAQAQATLKGAQQKLQRYQPLAWAGAVSRQELDSRVTAVATDQQDFRVASANINSAQADVRNNAAKVAQLGTQLAQTIVRAPVNGVVAQKIARIGDVTNGTQKLFSIIRNGLLQVEAQVTATELQQVRIDAPALITSTADSRVHWRGRVREIGSVVDTNRQATVKIDLPSTLLLRPGLFVQVAITTNTSTSLTVPVQSVVTPATSGLIVFLLEPEGIVHAQQVQVGGIVNGDRIEIKQGLQVGDRVVVTGARFLKDGDRVKVAS